MIPPLTVVIGYDPAEDAAYNVCRASLLRHASRPLHIVKLDLTALRRAGLYWREWRAEGGQRIDEIDGKPFSSDFSFSRFLAPALSLYRGYVLYCDCDFLFTQDVAELFDLADNKYAVHVVKHEHHPRELIKMGGLEQTRYRRKNWSSLCLFNAGHKSNVSLTPHVVNTFSGGWLHGFSWLRDEDIGRLPARWNWLSGVNEEIGIVPSGIHFTLGTPDRPGYECLPYADLWRAEQAKLEKNAPPIAGNSFADQT